MKTIDMMAAPVAMQPGGYMAKAYADHTTPLTPRVQLDYERVAGRGYRIVLRWPCSAPVTSVTDNPSLFPDACALLVPEQADAPWITMGAPGQPVQGVLWRADRKDLFRMHAEGLGTMQRGAPPTNWAAAPKWEGGYWQVVLQLPGWTALERTAQAGIAVWRGDQKERGGLKSVSTALVSLT